MEWALHHGILITTQDSDAATAAWNKATEIFPPAQISALSPRGVNDIRSFAVFPDGSTEGRRGSNLGDARRIAFKDWLDSRRFGDLPRITWAEVEYGETAPSVTDSSGWKD